MFTLSDLMFVNADTLASLQIIQSESHPNSHMQGPNKSTSGAKESLSVYGLFHYLASTPQGKQKLRQIFLRPSLDLSVIGERLATTSILLRPENQPLLEKIVKSLKMIKDIRAVVIHLQKGVSNVPGNGSAINRGVWGSLQAFTFHTLKIIEALTELSDIHPTAIASKVTAYNPPRKLLLIHFLVPCRDSTDQTKQDRTDGYRNYRFPEI
jgi:DNA mismatch repair protein MSH5